VDDLIEAMLRLMQTDDEITGPVNLGNPMEFSILDLAQKIISLVGSDSDIEFKPLPQDDPIQRRPDIGKARELLNWEPRVELDQGLKKTIAYFENLLKKTSPK
jgi:UDP-glucuronate decarboxylase